MEPTQASEGFGIQELLDCLKESDLLSVEEMERAVNAASQAGIDGPRLARDFVKAGLLSSYQMEAVCHREFEELRIGNYDVLDRLGAGGMGTVFKARHRRMKRIVALKVASRELTKDDTLVRRFQREVETIARLSHPNIVMAYDADEDAVGPFLVMEYVSGCDLATLATREGPFSVSMAVDCIVQAARGLEYAHGQGMIHRDIKPANLLRDAAGIVKVADLGLARFSSVGDAGGITQAGRILGTVDYMSPEQALDSASVDHRADIYCLGATLYFLLLAQPPYLGATMMATLLKHRDAPIPRLNEVRVEVPAALDAVFRRMMAKSPADRYQTMTEVVQALEVIQGSFGELVGAPSPLQRHLANTPAAATPNLCHEMGWDASQVPAGQTVDLHPPGTVSDRFHKVLLAEPSRTQAAIIRKYLQDVGVQQVIVAATGEDALRTVRRERPDLLISTLHLADMTGVQLAKQLNEELKEAAPGFVLISAQDEAAEAGTLSKCGQALLLHKPFTSQQLLEALQTVSARSLAASMKRSKLRVLIVDDSGAARLHARSVLTALGLSHFAEAADRAQAIAATARETFDLIVTDYNMPLLDGHGLVGYLKQNPLTASIPIILVTTEQDSAKLEAMRQLGVSAICDKSLPTEAVEKILNQLVRAP